MPGIGNVYQPLLVETTAQPTVFLQGLARQHFRVEGREYRTVGVDFRDPFAITADESNKSGFDPHRLAQIGQTTSESCLDVAVDGLEVDCEFGVHGIDVSADS